MGYFGRTPPEVIGVRGFVAQMFSLLETMRLQGGDALAKLARSAFAQLCELLSLAGLSLPGFHST